jgi:hypothetical protein
MFHPAMRRIPASFELCWLGGATGRGAEPSGPPRGSSRSNLASRSTCKPCIACAIALWEALRPPAAYSWRSFLHDPSGSIERPGRAVAQGARWAHASEQDHSRPGQQDRSNRMGSAEAPTHPLRTGRAGPGFSFTFVKLRGPSTDVGTVDRRIVSPVKKPSFLCSYHCWERCARISSWPGYNSSSLARGRIQLRKVLPMQKEGLATPGRTIHFLPEDPSASHCRASPRPTASSAWRSRLPAISSTWRPTPRGRRIWPSTCRTWRCRSRTCGNIAGPRTGLLLPQNPDDLLLYSVHLRQSPWRAASRISLLLSVVG